jgi:pimeloyl-ACP methyl ester carboxylesterase
MPPMKEKFLQVGGRKVAYFSVGFADASNAGDGAKKAVAGGRKPVFLLHGWGGSKESWEPLLEELRSGGVLDGPLAGRLSPLAGGVTKATDQLYFAMDFPGFGQSEEPEKGWDTGDYAHWFEHFVVAIYKAESVSGDYDIIVHSFGGRVLLKLYSPDFLHSLEARPEFSTCRYLVARPEKLVLIAAAGVKHVKSLRVRIAVVAARVGKAVMRLPVLRRLAPLAQKILYKALRTHDYEKTSGVMRETFLKVVDEDLKESIDQIHRPTLIVWGDQDSYVPVKDAYLMHEKIGGSELHIIEGGRHGIHKTHAKEVAAWIGEFLKK